MILFAAPAAIALAAAAIPACSSSKTTSNPGDGGSASDAGGNGVVSGPKDSHCTSSVTVQQAMCSPDAGADDGGMAMEDGGGDSYPPTMYNDEGDDDDCKYHVKWSAGGVAQQSPVTFDVTLTAKAGGAPVTGAPVRAEVFLDDTHPAPNTNQTSSDKGSGRYTVGPILFDKPGKWTVRFHFFEDCADSETSPHGHAAFYVQVP
jgi:hypothetical protein